MSVIYQTVTTQPHTDTAGKSSAKRTAFLNVQYFQQVTHQTSIQKAVVVVTVFLTV